MTRRIVQKLDRRKRYLQVAFNNSIVEAEKIIHTLPVSDRIIVEAGTPLIKRYGVEGIRTIRELYTKHLVQQGSYLRPYIVADMKTMDRGATEVEIAADGGADAIIALGSAPTETLNAFIDACESFGLDAMIDMMNVEFPLSVLRTLKRVPPVIVLHRGVDEERDNRSKMLPLHEIRRIKGAYDVMIAVAGGDTAREVQSAAFNDADIVVVWKSVYEANSDGLNLIEDFLKTIK